MAVVLLGIAVPLAASQYVAGIKDTSMTFPAPPRAGLTTDMTIGFTLQNDFVQGDSVELQLPGFFRDSYGNIPVGGGIFGLEWLVDTVDKTINKLKIKQIQPTVIPKDTPTSVTITQNAFIFLPLLGIKTNQSDLKIAVLSGSQAAAVPSWQNLSFVQAVGVLLNTTLNFSPEFVDYSIQVEVGFTHSSPLVSGDTITAFLDQFELKDPLGATITTIITLDANWTTCIGPYAPTTACSTGNITAKVEKQSSPAGVVITIYMKDDVEAFESVTVIIPASTGIQIPLEGSRPNNPNHVMGTSAILGPVPLTPATYIQSSQAVFAPTFSYTPAKLPTGECSAHNPDDGTCAGWVDESVDITIRFAHDADFQPAHFLIFSLPGFTRRVYQQQLETDPIATSMDCEAVTCDFTDWTTTGPGSSKAGNVTWNETTKKLTITFIAQAKRHEFLEVTIPKAYGFKLPRDGLDINQNSLDYKIYAAVISDTRSIPLSPPVGSFVSISGNDYRPSTELSTQFGRVDEPSQLTISWSLDGKLEEKQCISLCGTIPKSPTPASVQRDVNVPETVTLKLPSFTRVGGSLQHFPIQSSMISAGSWDDQTKTLTLTSAAVVPALTTVDVVIPSSTGIRLPSSGILKNTATFRISTNAASGPVPDTAVARSPAVAKMYDVTMMFEPMRANVSVAITIKFRLNRYVFAYVCMHGSSCMRERER
jgi:hypothetical protein